MAKNSLPPLSRREREIMDIIFRRGRATALEVLEDLPAPPTYSAVRALLTILENKGHLKHTKTGPRFLYLPTVRREEAGHQALERVVQTFFEGSLEKTIAALITSANPPPSPGDLERLERVVRRAHRGGAKHEPAVSTK